MSEADEITHSIAGLADPDPGARRVAARHLHLVASILCQSAINEWIKKPEFRQLLRPCAIESTGAPGQTPFVTGIAVQPQNFDKIRAANGLPRLAQVPPDQDALEFELRFGNQHDFDVLTTRDPGGLGAIARYLQKFGEGIQQIEICVTNVDRAMEILRTEFDLRPIYPLARAGADGTRVNFFLSPALGGRKLLIEIVEAKPQES
jgi:hypothetical protein